MAKIGIIAQSIDQSRLLLAQALKNQQHEVIFITSADPENSLENSFQCLSFFKKWNALEAANFFSKTWTQLPDILHFTFGESSSDIPHTGHISLAQLSRAIPGKVVVTSFLGKLPQKKLSQVLVYQSDIVTTATREDLMFMKRSHWLNSFSESEILPPLYPYLNTKEETHSDTDLNELCQNILPYAFFPTRPTWKGTLSHSCNVLINDRRIYPSRWLKKWFAHRTEAFLKPDKVFYTGFRFDSDSALKKQHEILKAAIQKARVVVTAFQEMPMTQLQRIHQIAVKYKVPVIATSHQTEIVPGLCIHQRNGYIANSLEDLEKLLLSFGSSRELAIDDLRLEHPKFELGEWNLGDAAMNELSRLYLKARSKKLLPRQGQAWVK